MRRDKTRSFFYIGPVSRILLIVLFITMLAVSVYIPRVFAAGAPNVAVSGGNGVMDMEAIEAECFAKINAEREKAGVPALTWSDDLYQAAKDRAPELAANFSHTRPDGNPWYTAVDAHGYENCRAGENLAYGQLCAEEAVRDWMNSAPHRATLLDGSLKETGICAVSINGVIYWAEEFGTLHE